MFSKACSGGYSSVGGGVGGSTHRTVSQGEIFQISQEVAVTTSHLNSPVVGKVELGTHILSGRL